VEAETRDETYAALRSVVAARTATFVAIGHATGRTVVSCADHALMSAYEWPAEFR
jgi:hypothetical protein